MRAAMAILLSIAAGAGVLASRTPASGTPDTEPALPAPIVITAGGVSFEIARTERIARIRTPARRIRRDGVSALGPRAVVFQRDHELWLAPLGGSARPIASREAPLGWSTGGGLYTYRYRDRGLLLRSDTGKLLKVIARRPLGSDYFVANGTLDFISGGGELTSAQGARVLRLASLASLGVSRDTWLQPVGRLLEFEDNSRIVVVRPDGSVFGWTPLREWSGGGISSPLVPAPDGRAVAFTATKGQTHATETVYVLRPGSHTATALYHEAVALGGCIQGADVQWHGAWLLYSNVEHNIAAIDTAGAHGVVRLTRLVGHLPGARNGFTAFWSGQPPEL